MTDAPTDDEIGETPEPLAQALGERYLTYALSTIMHRALPDARDGLKPVHRRLLWTMRQLRLEPGAGFKKSARVVGDVMGKYHPHGDQSIYDALVRAAQDFSLRYPLIDGQGNFGNIDGDGAAAMRYTESRLTAVAAALMEGLDEDAVDLRASYDGTESEPEVLPAAFPNLLANGASGIAVGMATAIPPHNVGELAEALLALIADPDADPVPLIPGPDFPTGGVLVEPPEAIAAAYRSGRGGFRLRATWAVEDLGRGTWQIVVTEMPYQVAKSKLVERLAELITTRKVAALADVRDESAEDIRLVLEPRARTVDPAVLMETLFKLSDLEVRVPLNMNVLIDGRTPRVCGLAEVLRAFLDHRRDVLVRRSRHRLGKIAHRLEVVGGYLIAFLNLDRVIEIIRYDDDPKAALMAEDWGGGEGIPGGARLTEVQAEAILNLRLRALRRLEELALVAERDALIAEQTALVALVADPARQWDQVAGQIRAMRDQFGAPPALRALRGADDIARARAAHAPYPPGARRTGLGTAAALADLPPEALIEREPVTVICSAGGWIRVLKGHAARDVELKFRDGDGPRFFLHAQTTDRLVAFATDGRAFTLGVDRLPGGRGLGEPLRLMIDLGNDEDLVALRVHVPGGRLLVAAQDGHGFVVAEADVLAQTKAGRQVLNLSPGVRAAVCRPVQGDHVAVVGQNRKMLVFPLADLPEMARGKGVRLQRYKDGGLSDATTFTLGEGLTWPDTAGRTRTVTDLADWLGKRAGAGAMAPRGFPRDNTFP